RQHYLQRYIPLEQRASAGGSRPGLSREWPIEEGSSDIGWWRLATPATLPGRFGDRVLRQREGVHHRPGLSDGRRHRWHRPVCTWWRSATAVASSLGRSEEHTSELQSRGHLVCRLLLEK